MGKDERQRALLRMLPGVDRILEQTRQDPSLDDVPRTVAARSVRGVIEDLRRKILKGSESISGADLSEAEVLGEVKRRAKAALADNLTPVVNATGVVVHTNLGRSPLCREALDHVLAVSGRYSNLELDLSTGNRGSRYSLVEDLICEISGAEAAMAVNNNAGAVLLCLDTVARGKEVIVSRGELVEIGGSFRIPDVMAKSGCILREIGTTNRTHPTDYENAVDPDTALLLKVHTSNYGIVGFTSAVSLKELVAIGARHGLPVMEDLGSGTFIDFSTYGLMKEPTVQESVASGANLVSFSGDKLLGGPQAGIIVGKRDMLLEIKKNPLTRALRIDKLTLAALESVLRLYREPEKAVEAIPTLRMLILPFPVIEKRTRRLAKRLKGIGNPRISVSLLDRFSRAGGGSLPLLELPSRCVAVRIQGISINTVEKKLRENSPPIIGRIEDDAFLMDLRTVQEEELSVIEAAFARLVTAQPPRHEGTQKESQA